MSNRQELVDELIKAVRAVLFYDDPTGKMVYTMLSEVLSDSYTESNSARDDISIQSDGNYDKRDPLHWIHTIAMEAYHTAGLITGSGWPDGGCSDSDELESEAAIPGPEGGNENKRVDGDAHQIRQLDDIIHAVEPGSNTGGDSSNGQPSDNTEGSAGVIRHQASQPHSWGVSGTEGVMEEAAFLPNSSSGLSTGTIQRGGNPIRTQAKAATDHERAEMAEYLGMIT